MSKFAIAGAIAAAGALAPIGAAVAGPVGAAASAVSPFQAPVEQSHYSGYRHHHQSYGFASYHARRYFGARHYHHAAAWRPYAYAYRATAWRPYPRHSAWAWRPHYPAAAPVVASPYFTSYSPAGAVSYPLYRIDHYKVDYASPTYSYGHESFW
jgi:hypothetical protein